MTPATMEKSASSFVRISFWHPLFEVMVSHEDHSVANLSWTLLTILHSPPGGLPPFCSTGGVASSLRAWLQHLQNDLRNSKVNRWLRLANNEWFWDGLLIALIIGWLIAHTIGY